MLAECLRILLKRWAWVAMVIVLALAAGVVTYKEIGPSQQSTAEVLLVPSSKQPNVNGATNPFSNLGGSLGIVAAVVQASVSDSRTAQRLVQQGNVAKYEVAQNLAPNAAPSLLVKTADRSGAMTQRTLAAVVNEIQRQLRQLQVDRGVPENLMIDTIVLTSTSHALPVHKGQVQISVIATLGVFFLFVALILLVERQRVTRRLRATLPAGPLTKPGANPQYRGRDVLAAAQPASNGRIVRRRPGRRTKVVTPTSDEPRASRDEDDDDPLTRKFLVSSDRSG